MKKYIAIIMLFCATALAEETNNITVEWDWGDSNRVGYVYQGNSSGNYNTNWMVKTNMVGVYVPPSSIKYFAVTSANSFGDQSDFSNELMIQRIKPKDPYITKYTITLTK